MSEKQNLARKRNWNKSRIMGFNIFDNQDKVFTPKEIKILQEIAYLKRHLLENWDKNSEKLLNTTLKPKCSFCGKRKNTFYQIENINYCYKCFKNKNVVI